MLRFSLLLALSLLLPAVVHAGDEAADPPPAADAVPPPKPAAPPAAPARGGAQPPSVQPPSTPATAPRDTFGALLNYREQRLQVRTQRILEGGGYTRVTRYYGFPFTPFIGVGTTYVVENPVTEYQTWSVYQGSARLTVPTYLDLVGRTADAAKLRRKVTNRRTGAHALLGVMIGGFAASLTGTSVFLRARTLEERSAGVAFAVGGGLTALFSFTGSVGLAGEARRLRWDFPSQFDGGVQSAVSAHNAALRDRLGLAPGEVRAIDAATR